MGEIFRRAYLVVIAATAKSPFAGYLANNPHAHAEDGRSAFKWHETMVRYGMLGHHKIKFRKKVHGLGEGKDACARHRIGKRVWTYQERLLASRCLIFQGREVIWECKSACHCECSDNQSTRDSVQYKSQILPWQPSLAGLDTARGLANQYFSSADDAYRFWKSAVKPFSCRDLRYVSDRLPAISALACIVHAATGDMYVAGLWKGDIISQLLWYNLPYYDEMKPYDAYVAPSWSWASMPAATHYNVYPPHIKISFCVDLVEVECVCSGPNPFGAVSDGYIVLKGTHCDAEALISVSQATHWPSIKLVLENRVIHDAESDHSEFTFLDGLRVRSLLTNIGSKECRTLQRDSVSTECKQATCSGKVRLLWVEEDVCLILAYSLRVRGSFERIGILSGEMAPPLPTYAPSNIRIV